MIHRRQSVRGSASAQARTSSRRVVARTVGVTTVLGAVLALMAGCGSDTTTPDAFRFGQVGEVEVVVSTPIGSGDGLIQQRLRWASSGEWSLQEQISYGDLVGDDRFERNVTDLEQSARQYGDAITHLTENSGESLFVDSLRTDLDPDCGRGTSRITFTIRDQVRDEERTWIRCAEGSLGNLDPATAGPDGAYASRIVQAVQTVRLGTVEAKGDKFKSQYVGSLPFGTLDRGESSGSSLTAPTVFTSFDPWQNFWAQHAGLRPIPPVNFDSSMVVVAMVGPREEAGDSVEVRRILQVGDSTQVEYVERVPGDYCSPAGRIHSPYHVVVAPRAPGPFHFVLLPREDVPCGS